MATTSLYGKVKQMIFANSLNNYGVAVVALDDNNRSFTSIEEDEITVTGSIAHLKKDVTYHFSGKVVHHERYGNQFQVESAEVVIEDASSYLVAYFSSENFKGIGKKTAMMIVETLGEDAVSRLRDNPALLDEMAFLNEKKRSAIMEGLQKDEIDDTQAFLTSLGINWRICNIIKMNYPTNTIAIVKENPYRMVPEVSGIGFATADKIGQKLNFREDHPFRLYAMVYALFSDACFQSGHTYFDRAFVEQTLWHRSNLPLEVYQHYVEQLLRDGYLVEDRDDFYLSEQWEAEQYIARYLTEFPYVGMPHFDINEVQECLALVEQTNHIHYDEVQKEAILQFFAEDFMILSGGPGTGKTTIVKGIIDTLKRIGAHYKIGLAAPTGRAAKRLAEVCEVESSTLHSMLKWNLETNTFGKNANDPLEFDVLIVDEFSMVDPVLFHHLLLASRNVKKMILIGDDNQLPSIRAGMVLNDLIRSQRFATVLLRKIFRQSEGSGIITLAHQIKFNEELTFAKGSDVLFVPCRTSQITSFTLQLMESALEKGYSLQDIQILAPMYKGQAGIDALNRAIQERFNPFVSDSQEFVFGQRIFRVNDKVIQLKNQATDDIFNGDIGIITQVHWIHDHHPENSLVVDFDGNAIEYRQDELIKLRLAYAISIHKSQGSEYPIVLLPISAEHLSMLQKKLLYTGITRAKKSLILLGDRELFDQGIQVGERHPRASRLVEKIHERFELSR